MKTFIYFLISLSILIIIGCEENINNNSNIPEQLPQTFDIEIDSNKYYNNEIFMEKYKSIYGKWLLNNISGGFSGAGYEPDFEQLWIQKIGIFKIIKNDSVVIYGKIEIEEQDENTLLITLIEDSIIGNLSFFDMEKYVLVNDSNLSLNSPCCDRYNYHFTRCEVYSDDKYYQENPVISNITITQIPIPEENYYSIVFFTDDENGYLLSDENLIIKTDNGGISWSEDSINTELPLYSMYFIDKNVGFVAGGESSCGGSGCTVPGSIILKTIDGGKSWLEKEIPYKWSCLYSIHFVNDKTGYAVGLGLKVKTEDGGESWTEFEIDYKGYVGHVSFINENVGFICGLKGNIFKTNDGGLNWNKLPINTTNYLNTVFFIDENTGFAGHNGNLFKTSDGGYTWEILENSPYGVNSMYFQSKDKGFVIGKREYSNGNCNVWISSINFTEDSGKTWKGDNRINGKINSASYPNNNTYFILEEKTKLYKIEIN